MKIKRIGNHNLPLPLAATSGSAGLDLQACIDTAEIALFVLYPGFTIAIPCGFAFDLTGYTGLVCSRSGLAKRGIHVLNSPGIADSDYVGQIGVILHNSSQTPYEVKHGDRIAQLLIITQVIPPPLEEVAELHETERGAGGFGSTGR